MAYHNYLVGVRLGCVVAGVCEEGFRSLPQKRILKALRNRGAPPRKKLFLGQEWVIRVAEAAEAKGDIAFAMACVASYAFLLRVPSEALSLTVWHGGDVDGQMEPHEHYCCGRVGDVLVV